MPLPPEIAHHVVALADAARTAYTVAGLSPDRAKAEAAGLLTAIRGEAEDAHAHNIDSAEIVERVDAMARMHRFIATGHVSSTYR